MSAPDPPALAAHWLSLALGDLLGAEATLHDQTLPVRQAAQLAQQAAEKAIKGAIIFGAVSPPYTHDLGVLARLLPPDWGLDRLDVDLARLSGAYSQAQYPSYFQPPFEHDDVAHLVAEATAIVSAILDGLSARGLDRPEPA